MMEKQELEHLMELFEGEKLCVSHMAENQGCGAFLFGGESLDAKSMERMCDQVLVLLRMCEAAGGMENLKIAVDRNVPVEVTDIHVDEYYCPTCGAENLCDDRKVGDKFCPNCGQRYLQKIEI